MYESNLMDRRDYYVREFMGFDGSLPFISSIVQSSSFMFHIAVDEVKRRTQDKYRQAGNFTHAANVHTGSKLAGAGH